MPPSSFRLLERLALHRGIRARHRQPSGLSPMPSCGYSSPGQSWSQSKSIPMTIRRFGSCRWAGSLTNTTLAGGNIPWWGWIGRANTCGSSSPTHTALRQEVERAASKEGQQEFSKSEIDGRVPSADRSTPNARATSSSNLTALTTKGEPGSRVTLGYIPPQLRPTSPRRCPLS